MFYIAIRIDRPPELLPAPAKHRTLADLKIPVARNHMNQTDIEQARFNMIEQQIRPWEVLDQRVLDTMQTIPREDTQPGRRTKMVAGARWRIHGLVGHGL